MIYFDRRAARTPAETRRFALPINFARKNVPTSPSPISQSTGNPVNVDVSVYPAGTLGNVSVVCGILIEN